MALESASDSFAWTNALTAAERKGALGKAPAYMYYFKWRSPVRDGKLKAMHCMEIPFVFDNPDAGKPMTGSGEDRYALASKISGAWAAFAHTGNPSQKGLAWPAYTTAKRATMVLDDKCEVVDDPRKEVRLTPGVIALLPSMISATRTNFHPARSPSSTRPRFGKS